MIIECQACRARYRLDESKIKGKGARIRCRKCGESIIVMKGDIPPPKMSPPAEKHHFDLRAVLQEPEKKPPPPPRKEVDAAFESIKSREQEMEQAHPPAPEKPPEPSLTRDEAAAALESPLFREEEEPSPPAAEEPASPAEEEMETFAQEPPEPSLTRDEAAAALETILGKKQESEQETPPVGEEWALPREGEDISFLPALGKEEDISSPQETGETPVLSPEDLAGEEAHLPPPLTEKGWDHPGQDPTEFLGLDTDLPDFLKKRETARGPSKPFDISEQLSEMPIGGEGEDMAPVSPTLDSPESPAHSMDHDGARAETLQDQLSDLVESESTEETLVLDSPPTEISSPQPMEIERQPAIRPRPSAPSGKPSFALLALLFVVLAGGGAYLAFTEPGQKTLRTLIPSMESLWLGGKESVKPFSISNLIGYYEMGDKAGRMFVIKGVATNQGRKKNSGIRIRAELLDGNHQTIAEKTVYAGNIINGLRSTEQEKIETAMSNRFGDKLSNVDVAPGKSVPFMLVFFDPPEGIEEYRLEALDAD